MIKINLMLALFLSMPAISDERTLYIDRQVSPINCFTKEGKPGYFKGNFIHATTCKGYGVSSIEPATIRCSSEMSKGKYNPLSKQFDFKRILTDTSYFRVITQGDLDNMKVIYVGASI